MEITRIERSDFTGDRVVGPLASHDRDARLILNRGALLVSTTASHMSPQRAENMAKEIRECVDAIPALSAQL